MRKSAANYSQGHTLILHIMSDIKRNQHRSERDSWKINTINGCERCVTVTDNIMKTTRAVRVLHSNSHSDAIVVQNALPVCRHSVCVSRCRGNREHINTREKKKRSEWERNWEIEDKPLWLAGMKQQMHPDRALLLCVCVCVVDKQWPLKQHYNTRSFHRLLLPVPTNSSM